MEQSYHIILYNVKMTCKIFYYSATGKIQRLAPKMSHLYLQKIIEQWAMGNDYCSKWKRNVNVVSKVMARYFDVEMTCAIDNKARYVWGLKANHNQHDKTMGCFHVAQRWSIKRLFTLWLLNMTRTTLWRLCFALVSGCPDF